MWWLDPLIERLRHDLCLWKTHAVRRRPVERGHYLRRDLSLDLKNVFETPDCDLRDDLRRLAVLALDRKDGATLRSVELDWRRILVAYALRPFFPMPYKRFVVHKCHLLPVDHGHFMGLGVFESLDGPMLFLALFQ